MPTGCTGNVAMHVTADYVCVSCNKLKCTLSHASRAHTEELCDCQPSAPKSTTTTNGQHVFKHGCACRHFLVQKRSAGKLHDKEVCIPAKVLLSHICSAVGRLPNAPSDQGTRMLQKLESPFGMVPANREARAEWWRDD